MRALSTRLIVLAGLAAVAVLLLPLAFVISLPTTFACRSFMNASAEAKLVYPGGQRLSYESHEGTRQLIEMSSPQTPGFNTYQAVPANDQEVFRWFDAELQALGWKPLNPESRFQVVQSSGETTRGGGAEGIALVRFEAGRIPPGITERPPEGQDLLRYSYYIGETSSVPGCR